MPATRAYGVTERAQRIGGVIRLREARCRSVGERGDGAVGVGHLDPAVEGVPVAKSKLLRRKEAKAAASRKTAQHESKLCGSLDGVLKQLVYERLVGLALPRGQLA